MNVAEAAKMVMEQIKETVRYETVVGTPVQAEDSVIIPVSRVSFGFGAGGGGSDDASKRSGMGTGGGATIEPVAFVVVSKGKAQLLPLKSREATMTRIIDLVPSLIDLFKDKKPKEAEKAESKQKKQESDSK